MGSWAECNPGQAIVRFLRRAWYRDRPRDKLKAFRYLHEMEREDILG